MAKASCKIPYDWWGLTMSEVKKVVRECHSGTGARLTNLQYEYRGSHGDFKLKGLGSYRIVANSGKGLRQVLDAIFSYRRKQTMTPKEEDRIAIESMRNKRKP